MPPAQESALIGRVWRPADQTWMSRAALHSALVDSRFVLLGEQHDNPDHHRRQAHLLDVIAADGRRPAVAFEMLDTAQQPALARFIAQPHPKAADLGRAVGWTESGWPPWPQYAPIARAALAHHLPILAANLPPATVQAVARKGLGAIDPARVRSLDLRRRWPASRRRRLRKVLAAAHCHLLPAAALDGIAAAQRLRDAFMAQRLREAGGRDGAVLITGAEHARTDFGVPLHLRRTQQPKGDVFAVALVGVRPGLRRPRGYAALFHAQHLPFDAVLFTAAASHGHSCAALRKRFGNNKTDS